MSDDRFCDQQMGPNLHCMLPPGHPGDCRTVAAIPEDIGRLFAAMLNQLEKDVLTARRYRRRAVAWWWVLLGCILLNVAGMALSLQRFLTG